MWRFLLGVLILLGVAQVCSARAIINPITGKFDYVSTSSGAVSGDFVLKAGDTMTGSLTFSSSTIGPILTDSAGCTWLMTAATSGNLVTTLQSCTSSVSGQCMGLLCAVTYP